MPHLSRYAGEVGLVGRIAEDKAVLPAVLLQPEVNIVDRTVDVHGQPQLVFAGTRPGDPLLRQLNGLLLGVALLPVLPDLVIVQALLFFLCPKAGDYDGAQFLRLRGIQHLHQRIVDPLIHLLAAGNFHQIDRIVLRERIPAVDQRQVPRRIHIRSSCCVRATLRGINHGDWIIRQSFLMGRLQLKRALKHPINSADAERDQNDRKQKFGPDPPLPALTSASGHIVISFFHHKNSSFPGGPCKTPLSGFDLTRQGRFVFEGLMVLFLRKDGDIMLFL